MYGMPHDDVYCYPDSDVLINKFGIRDADELDKHERAITEQLSFDIFREFDFGNCDFGDWCRIHSYLFGDIYDWAGEIRTIDIYKGYSDFVLADDIMQVAEDVFEDKASKNDFLNLGKDDFCREMAYFLDDIDHLHPFREGNGRSERILAREIANRAGWDLGIERMGRRGWHESMVATRSTTSLLERMLRSVVRPSDSRFEQTRVNESHQIERTPIVETFSSAHCFDNDLSW